MDTTTIGIDVSKAKLDICFLSSGEVINISNDTKGYNILVKHIKQHYNVQNIIIEHTGNYQKEVVSFLQKQKLCVCVVNPSKVRAFAKAAGILAKTDKIDAWVLAKYGELFNPAETNMQDREVEKLRELVQFRAQLVDACKLFKARLDKHPSSFINKETIKIIAHLQKQEKAINAKIKEFISSHSEFLKKAKILHDIPGVGEQTVSVFLSYLPELGCLEKRKLVALCGLAPINKDSGTMRGQRHIYGGRKVVRNALYMSTISAIVHNQVIKQYYLALKQRGKPAKVALVACMRKILIYANSLLKKI